MSINGVNGAYGSYAEVTSAANAKNAKSTSAADQAGTDPNSAAAEKGVVYEPSASTKSVRKSNTRAQNTAIVNQLKADAENRQKQLQDMVTKMISKQGQTWQYGSAGQGGVDIYKVLRSGNLKVDAETAARAKADTAEDGYWGVKQTSDRILSFAKALSGSDTKKADELLNAFKKGFGQATGRWGGRLPDICQRTYDETLKKFEAWKNGTENE